MKIYKNLFLTIIVMVSTLCITGADVVKDKFNMNNENKEPEEILPQVEPDDTEAKSVPPIMAGKVLPSKDDEMKPCDEDNKMAPFAGEVIPVPAIERPLPTPSGGMMCPPPPSARRLLEFYPGSVPQAPESEPYRDTFETHATGDIPPSYDVDTPQKKSKSGFLKSLINKFKRDNY